MSEHDCIFCKIISGEIPSKIITQTDDILVIQDVHQKAPIHYLIIPKMHVENIKFLHENDSHYLVKMMMMAKQLSRGLAGSKSFRLIINNGPDSGQSVFHMHCHFLSGKKMSDF